MNELATITPMSNLTLDEVNINARGLIFPENLTEKGWESFGRKLKLIIDAGPFIIGDWVNWGISHYGATLKTIRAILNDHAECDYLDRFSDKTLFEYGNVATKIPAHVRVEGVSFSIHQTVARICPKKYSDDTHAVQVHTEMHKWLVLAREKNLGIVDVRHAIANRAQIEEYVKATPAIEETEILPSTGATQDTAFASLAIAAQRELNRLNNWFEDQGDISAWPIERKEAVKKQLRATVQAADVITDKFILLCQ